MHEFIISAQIVNKMNNPIKIVLIKYHPKAFIFSVVFPFAIGSSSTLFHSRVCDNVSLYSIRPLKERSVCWWNRRITFSNTKN